MVVKHVKPLQSLWADYGTTLEVKAQRRKQEAGGGGGAGGGITGTRSGSTSTSTNGSSGSSANDRGEMESLVVKYAHAPLKLLNGGGNESDSEQAVGDIVGHQRKLKSYQVRRC